MAARVKNLNWPVAAGILLAGLYLVTALAHYVSEWDWIANQIGSGESAIEFVEAFLWIAAFGLFSYSTVKTWPRRHPQRWWFAFFALFCFFAAGEELSWGQHLGIVEPSEALGAINAQGELNVHNLNVAMVLGLAPSHPLYPYLDNFNLILNPLVYLFCTIIWVGVPLVRRYDVLARSAILKTFPLPATGTSVFFAANVVAYAVVDKLLFDVGELFEFAISVTVCMHALDSLARRSDETYGAVPR